MSSPWWRWWPLALLSCGPRGGLSALVVSVLFPVEGSEPGLSAAMQRGVLEARVGRDFVYEEYVPKSAEDARALLDHVLEPHQGRRLVITGGELYARELDERACDLNGHQVLQLEGKPRTCATLRSIELQTYASGFLAGVAALSAESLAPRHATGAIVARSARLEELVRGFVAGVEYVGGQAEVLRLDSFNDAELADPVATRAQVRALADTLDVMLVAGYRDDDVLLSAVRERNQDDPEHPLRLIVIDQDLSIVDATLTLGSIVRRYDMEVRNSILAAEQDAFAPGHVLRGERDGQTELLLNPAYRRTALDTVPFMGCEACETLADALRAAQEAAIDAAEVPP